MSITRTGSLPAGTGPEWTGLEWTGLGGTEGEGASDTTSQSAKAAAGGTRRFEPTGPVTSPV